MTSSDTLPLSEDQQALQDTLRGFLAGQLPPATLRAALETRAGYSPELHARLAREFGLAGVTIPREFGGRGLPSSFTPDMLHQRIKGGADATAIENTTLVAVVTDAILTKPQAKRLAMIAQTGMARAIYPVHAPLDGDVVFAAATCKTPIDPLFGLTELGMVAANVVARAIARGVYCATALPFLGALPAWGDRHG